MVGVLDSESRDIIRNKVDTSDLEFISFEELPEWRKLNLDLPTTYDNFGTGNFNLRLVSKFVLIRHVLRESGLPVIFTDGDIVFLKNPVTHFQNNALLSDKAVFFQNDRRAGDFDSEVKTQYRRGRLPNASIICAGFSVWRPRETHHHLIEAVKNGISAQQCDQTTINRFNFWRKRNVQLLRQDLFPNGSFVFAPEGPRDDVFDREEAYLVHANWMLGIEEKVKRLKAGGFWLI